MYVVKVEISFLKSCMPHVHEASSTVKIFISGMLQIAFFFSSLKFKKSLPWEGDTPPPPPGSVAPLPQAWSLRSLAKFDPPNILAHYATDYYNSYICG